MTNFAEMKKLIDDISKHLNASGQCKDFKKVKVHFRTFDEHFDENADEFQNPEDITSVQVDILNWDSVTFTIERKIKDLEKV